MYKRCFKRIIDFIIALVASPFVLLVIVVMAPFIYVSDPGPIFYNAKRLGYKGKAFKMFKLRSMYVNAPDIRNDDGSTFNSSNDPRVTKIGKIMRKTSIDELPQFLNVLIGDMSFIGPRPGLPDGDWNDLGHDELKRRSVRPGITGYSQAYYRNSDSMDVRMKNDIKYAETISLVGDIKILFKTVESVLKRKNINRND